MECLYHLRIYNIVITDDTIRLKSLTVSFKLYFKNDNIEKSINRY